MAAAREQWAEVNTPAKPLLAFDTSTDVMAVAAAGPRGVFAANLPGGAAASAQLLPALEAVLAQAGLVYGDLAAIAFGRGPGAFTGLRTSCAVAQGLGFGLGRPLLPLDSLLVVAEDARDALPQRLPADAARVAVAMDARMDEIYGAIYESEASGWRVLRSPALYTLAAWNAVFEEAGGRVHCQAGSALNVFGERLKRRAGQVEWPVESHRALALMRLAQRAFEAGEAIDAAAALPLYLRDKIALTTVERLAVKAAAAGGGTVR